MSSRDLPARTVEHAGRVWPLAAVPLVATLLDWGRLQTLVGNTDRFVSVTFGVPRPVSTLWSFVNARPSGFSVGSSAVGSPPLFVVALFASAVVSGVLAAGYLGSIDAALDGRYDFLAAVRAYASPLVGYSLLEAAVGLTLVVVLLGSEGLTAPPLQLLVVVGIGLFVLAYLFFAAPYLVVVEDRALVSALQRAYALATSDGRVLVFFVGYLVVSAVFSVPVSLLAFAAPPAGVAVAAVASAPLALLFNVATLLFVRDLVGAEPAGDGWAVEA